MGLWDKMKNIMIIPEEDEYDEAVEDTEEVVTRKQPEEAPVRRSEPAAKVFQGGRSKTVQYQPPRSSIQVVLVKPERFEDAPSIADHLNDKKTVVLNLEAADRDVSRRILDFLSGVAYANHGNIRKVANSTFIIVPTDVDVMGELMLDDFNEDKFYY